MSPGDEVYVLMLGPDPVSVHDTHQGADEAMAGHTAAQQADMRVMVATYAE